MNIPAQASRRASTCAGSATSHLLLALVAVHLTACALRPSALSSMDAAQLGRPLEAYGDAIYRGEVTPKGGSTPAFRYERRVADEGELTRATHVTLLSSGPEAPLLVQSATHTRDYRLVAFEEVSAQTGLVGSVRVGEDGTLAFEVRRSGVTERRTEPPGPQVVVGPTLFGFVLAHLDELSAGEEPVVRMVVAQDARTYAFRLRAERRAGGMTVWLQPTEFLVRLAVAPMQIDFDERGVIVGYHGRVPPLLDGHAFEADVRYTYVRPFR